jgi:hypothetical protein
LHVKARSALFELDKRFTLKYQTVRVNSLLQFLEKIKLELKIRISANPLAKTQRRQEKIKHFKSGRPFAALAALREAIF